MLHIRTFGTLSVLDGDRPVSGAAQQPRRLAILALLARAGSRGVSRDRLLLLLWPDADEERGRRGLNQALYALRQDLGGEDVILGAKDLRLNPDRIDSDLQRFLDAKASGRLDEAAATWGGPFLDGFNLSGVPDFERWVDEERAALHHDYAATLEQLASGLDGRGEHLGAVNWWRRLAALDPLNPRIAEALVRSLVKAGDAPGALRHIEVHAALREADLGLGPEPALVRLSERIRKGELAAPIKVSAQHPVPDFAIEKEPHVTVTSDPLPVAGGQPVAGSPSALSDSTPPVTGNRQLAARLVTGIGLLVTAAVITAFGLLRKPVPSTVQGFVAVGRIQDYTGGDSSTGSGPIGEMLATNLARASGVNVVSTSRLYEVLQQLHADGDSSVGAIARAARLAGASELVEGALYRQGKAEYRLDLRRIDLASGSVLGAETVRGSDYFVLADSGTALLVKRLGGRAPEGSLASVSTRSEAAFRLYEAGLRAFFRKERAAAEELFLEALREDSTFAMARYWSGIAAQDQRQRLPRLGEAVHLAEHASERDRLIIRSAYAFDQSDPGLRAVAESLVARFPAEIEGHMWLGNALLREGQFLAAIPVFRRVIALDSLGLAGRLPRCQACVAMTGVTHAYESVDSFGAAERVTREWMHARPSDPSVRVDLADLLVRVGRFAEARAQLDTARQLGIPAGSLVAGQLTVEQFAENWPVADSILQAHFTEGSPADRADRLLEYSINLRHQGRFEEALHQLDAARKLLGSQAQSPQGWRNLLYYEGQVLYDAGRYREAAKRFEQAGRVPRPGERASAEARNLTWSLTHAAGALAAAGDSSRLAALADSISRFGSQTGLARDRQIASYPRGLLEYLRRDYGAAEGELRRAIYSTSLGYPRVNLALARALREGGRPDAAIPVLQAALHNVMSGNGLYATRTEMHEAIALAFDDINMRDSAQAHWKFVARSWASADDVLQERYRQALRQVDR